MISRTDYENEIDRLRELVETGLQELLPESDEKSKTLYDAMGYTLGLPGKRIRPVLLMLAYKSIGGDSEEEALPFACALEMIHNYSLIHDDLPAMDDDDLRRGKPTNHKVFGEAMAILAGDGLLSQAFEILHDEYLSYFNASLEDESIVYVLRQRILAGKTIVHACGCQGMIAGQVADIEAEGKAASIETVEYIHENKTAAIIRAAIMAGMWLTLGDYYDMDEDAVIRALFTYGDCLGKAFQVADDILDYESTTEVLGKTAGKDLKAGKATYPATLGIEASRQKLLELTGEAIQAAEELRELENTKGLYIDILQELARDLAGRLK